MEWDGTGWMTARSNTKIVENIDYESFCAPSAVESISRMQTKPYTQACWPFGTTRQRYPEHTANGKRAPSLKMGIGFTWS